MPEREHAGRLCRRHANALVVPRGWTVDDRRQPVPQLFRNLDRAALAAERAEKKSPVQARKKKTPASPVRDDERENSATHEPTLFEEITHSVDADTSDDDNADSAPNNVVVDPDETQAIAWSPATVASETTNDDDEPPVFGRLMGRAFRHKGAQ